MSVGVQRTTITLAGTAPVNANGATAVIGTTPNTLGGYDSLTVVTTVAGNTGGTLDVYLQWSPDISVTAPLWYDWHHYVQLAAGAAAITVQVAAAMPTKAIGPITIGIGATPALAANTFVGGDWGAAIRVLAVSGAGTTVGGSVTSTITASRLASTT